MTDVTETNAQRLIREHREDRLATCLLYEILTHQEEQANAE